MNKPIQINVLAVLSILTLAGFAVAQSPIILRDLSLIKDQAIASFDRTDIVLADGSKLKWDQILRADVGKNRQKEFDRNITEIGLPLFRLKSRIKIGDWAGAGSIAEPMFENVKAIEGSQSNIDYLIALATMKNRLNSGNRAGAVLPFLRAFEIQTEVDSATRDRVGTHRIPDDRNSIALTPDLLPVWFDLEQVAKSEKQIGETNRIGNSLGRSIYLASMKIELDQTAEAETLINQIESSNLSQARLWAELLRARILQKSSDHVKCQTLLDRNAKEFTGNLRPVAIYYRAMSELELQSTLEKNVGNQAADIQLSRSALMLLRIPALYGEQHPDLAAAALYHTAEIAKLRGRPNEAQKLTKQLLRRYPRTYHGTMAASESGKL